MSLEHVISAVSSSIVTSKTTLPLFILHYFSNTILILFLFKSEKNCNFAVWTLRAAIGQNVPLKTILCSTAHHIGYILYPSMYERVTIYKETKQRESVSLFVSFVQHISCCRRVLADLLWNIKKKKDLYVFIENTTTLGKEQWDATSDGFYLSGSAVSARCSGRSATPYLKRWPKAL